MSKLIMRLDDACPKRNIENWNRMEALLDKYSVRPLVGIIPDCRDEGMNPYPSDESFWQRVASWESKGWCLAMHGCTHVYSTDKGGLNPINDRSEFAGEPLDVQRRKIIEGLKLLRSHGIEPKVFFAPSHTFDAYTLQALEECSDIRIISDTVANAPYRKGKFTYVPQQSGLARKLPFEYVTYCYHPNQMTDSDFTALESFFKDNAGAFIDFPTEQSNRSFSAYDALVRMAYFTLRKIKIKLAEMRK